MSTGPQPTSGFIETLSKAITDDAFRQQLFNDPDGTLQGLGLSQKDQEFLSRFVREKSQEIEKAAALHRANPAAWCGVIMEVPFPPL